MFEIQYLNSIFIILGVFILIIIASSIYLLVNKRLKHRKLDFDLREYTLYLKYNVRTKKVTIENYQQEDMATAKIINEYVNEGTFKEDLARARKSNDHFFYYMAKFDDLDKYLNFTFKEMIGTNAIIKCEVFNQAKYEERYLKTMDDLRLEHSLSEDKNGAFFYINIKNFNSLNQRYGRTYGDYILEIIRARLNDIHMYNCSSAYAGDAQYAVFVNKKISRRKALRLANHIVEVLSRPIQEKYLMLDIRVGVGVCLGEYENFDDFTKYAYVAADYAKNRLSYNVILYGDTMQSEENLVMACQRIIDSTISTGKVEINYSPVYNPKKNKYVGYISYPDFKNLLTGFDKIKQVATQLDKINEFMYTIYKKQLVSFLKRRPSKQSKLFINAKLEDLTTFMEVYFSERSFQECKIVICLDVKKGYEMINKFSNITSSINRLIGEGIELAACINQANMYDYDYILKISDYLILDDNIISVTSKNNIIENKLSDMIELAKKYELELFATNVDDYLKFEFLLKYKVQYISGLYFGGSVSTPTGIEYTKTRLLSKIVKDSSKNKK